MRFPNSLKILISSVNRRSGLLYDKFARFYGKDDPDTLVVMGESLQFNPTLDTAIIDRELERDWEHASAEYLCRWRDDLSLFLDRELVEGAVDRGIRVRPPDPRLRYFGFVDSSSGRGDSFVLVICHVDPGGQRIIDHIYELKSPFNVDVAVCEAAQIAESYDLHAVTGDRYAVGFVEEAFRKQRIAYRTSDKDKSALYLDALPLFTTGRARLLDNPRLVHQLVSLERRSSPTGKDQVSHPDHRSAHDDVANAVCGALVLAGVDDGPLIISDETLRRSRLPASSTSRYSDPRNIPMFL